MWQFITGIAVGLLLIGVPRFRRSGDRKTPADPASEHAKALETLAKLTGELAHEINNPLSTIKVNLTLVQESLEADAEDSRASRALVKLGIIQKETQRLQAILDGFLKYIGKPELHMIRVDLNELVGEIIDFYTPQAHNHGLALRHGLTDKPLICKADEPMIKQVLLNMLINAQQAMPEGGELMIRTFTRDNSVCIQINDTGPGMTPDVLEHIFEPYFSSRPKGTGLGLPIAKKIVEAHGGAIEVDSDPGKGTSFTIRLPYDTMRVSSQETQG